MGTINLTSPFISYNLSPEEIVQGSMLTELTRQVLQNRLHQAVMEKIYIPRTAETVQQEAELAGVIRILTDILDANTSVQMAMPEAVPEQSETSLADIFPRARPSSGHIAFPE